MNRKSTEVRQQEIMQATLNLIAKEGVQGLTTARLAEQVGISEAALYRHFENKTDMVSATVDLVGDRLIQTLMSLTGQGKPLEKLQRVLLAHLGFIEKNPGMARLLFSDEVHFNVQALKGKLYTIILRYLSFIQNLLAEGIAAGQVRKNVDPVACAYVFLGMIQTQVLLWSLSGGQHALTTKAKALWVLYERMVIREN